MIDKSRFKNATGFKYLRGLFFETRQHDESPVYTLKAYDHTVNGVVYPSLYKLYIASNDPTEYKFAVEHLESWQHWQELTQCTWFQEHVQAWRLELSTKLQSEALANIMLASSGNTRDAFQASKYLVEKGWVKASKGRPDSATIKKEADRIATEQKQVSEDAERLQLN